MAKGFKLKTKTKGKRWKKGHSSDSNPVQRKFRDEALRHLGVHQAKPTGGLTQEALAKHEADTSTSQPKLFSIASDDGRSIGGLSWATQATSISFRKLQNFWNQNDAFHREVLAVYGAVTETIAEQSSNTRSETAYFAALLTFVESAITERPAEVSNSAAEAVEQISLTAAVFLLHLVTKRVPRPVLRASFGTVSKLLSVLLEEYNDDIDLLKSALVVLAHSLKSLDAASWLEPSTKHMYQYLLSFTTHPKPKVRKVSQDGIKTILFTDLGLNTEATAAPVLHPAAAMTGEHLQRHLVEHLGDDEPHVLLHTLGAMGKILGQLPSKYVKSLCEATLGLMKMSHTLLRMVCMQTLHQLFSSHLKGVLTSATLAQLITALYTYQPSEEDKSLMNIWLSMMDKGLIALNKSAVTLCLQHLPHFFKSCMKALRNEGSGQAATDCLVNLMNKVMVPGLAQTSKLPITELLTCLKQGLGYQYQASWTKVLHVMGLMFQEFGSLCRSQCPQLTSMCLRSLAELRESPYFPAKQDIDKAMGRAVGGLGPAFLTSAVPLNITGTEEDDLDFPRGWLLPVLRDNISHTELNHFLTTWLQLARNFHLRAEGSNKVEAKTYSILEDQVWSLLPGYCTHPNDVAKSFPILVTVIGPALTQRPDIRPHLMTGIRKLVTHCQNNESDRLVVQQYSRKFIATLFNIFMEESKVAPESTSKKHLSVLETIKAVLKITESSLVQSYYDRILQELKQNNTSIAWFDMAIALASQIDELEKFEDLYEFIKTLLDHKDRQVQKRANKCLEVLCCSKATSAQSFIKSRSQEIIQLLLDTLSKANPVAKLPRLRCLQTLVCHVEKDDMEFFKKVYPEAVLSTVGSNARVKSTALDLVMSLCEHFLDYNGKEMLHNFEQCCKLSTSMQVAVMLCLRHIIKVKNAIFPSAGLLKCCKKSLGSSHPDVQAAAVRLLRSISTKYDLAGHITDFMASLAKLRNPRIKLIYRVFLQKFGYEALVKMSVNPQQSRQLKNIERDIRKTKKAEKKEETRVSKEEDSSDSEDEEKPAPLPSTQAFLKEGEDIIDFQSPEAVSTKVLSSKPRPKRKMPTWDRTAPDGRMIIGDDDERSDAEEPALKMKRLALDDTAEKEKTVYGGGIYRKNPHKKVVSTKKKTNIRNASHGKKKSKNQKHLKN